MCLKGITFLPLLTSTSELGSSFSRDCSDHKDGFKKMVLWSYKKRLSHICILTALIHYHIDSIMKVFFLPSVFLIVKIGLACYNDWELWLWYHTILCDLMSHNVNRSPPCLQKAEGNFQANVSWSDDHPCWRLSNKYWVGRRMKNLQISLCFCLWYHSIFPSFRL